MVGAVTVDEHFCGEVKEQRRYTSNVLASLATICTFGQAICTDTIKAVMDNMIISISLSVVIAMYKSVLKETRLLIDNLVVLPAVQVG